MHIRKTHADFYTPEALLDALRWARGRGGEIANNIPYWSELASSAGVNVILMPEPGTSQDDIQIAASQVTAKRDVVSLAVMDYSDRLGAHQLTFELADGNKVQVSANTPGMAWMVGGAQWMTIGVNPRSLQSDWDGNPIKLPEGALLEAHLGEQPVSLSNVFAAKTENGARVYHAVFDINGTLTRSLDIDHDSLIAMARATHPVPAPEEAYEPDSFQP